MPRCLRALPVLAPGLLMVAGALLAAPALHGQMSPDAGSVLSPPRTSLPHSADDNGLFRDNPEFRERLQRGRAAERQRRIVDDSNRLVALTTQYRQQVTAHGAPTSDDGKLLAEIEKVARDLKDRMRGM